MSRRGFIRSSDEIKFLTLYALTYVRMPLEFQRIFDICSWCDEGFGYFEFNEAFLEMIESNHLSEVEKGKYKITEKGELTAAEFHKKIPVTIRDIASVSALRVVREVNRDASIKTHTEQLAEVDFDVHLSMENVFSINFNVATKEQAQMIETKFKNNAEKIYEALLEALTKEY